MVLEVVRSDGGDNVDRVALAAAHIEIAIAHLNNAAQSAMQPDKRSEDTPHVEQLRLLVTALADIRESLRSLRDDRPRTLEDDCHGPSR